MCGVEDTEARFEGRQQHDLNAHAERPNHAVPGFRLNWRLISCCSSSGLSALARAVTLKKAPIACLCPQPPTKGLVLPRAVPSVVVESESQFF